VAKAKRAEPRQRASTMPGMNWRRRILVGAAAAAVLVGAPRISAWGAVGHHVVARIAWARMTPGARAQATTLLAGGQDAFVAASTWADEVRAHLRDLDDIPASTSARPS